MTIQYGHECKGALCPVHKQPPKMIRRIYGEVVLRHFSMREIQALEEMANAGMLPDTGHRVLDEEPIAVIAKVAAVAQYYAEDARRVVTEMEGP